MAAVQIIVYAGAIVILFLFVIMFLGVDRAEDITVEPLGGQRPLAIVFSVITLGGILAMAATAHWVTGAQAGRRPIEGRRDQEPSPTTPRATTSGVGKASCSPRTSSPSKRRRRLLVIAVVGAVVPASTAALVDGARPTPMTSPRRGRLHALGMSLVGEPPRTPAPGRHWRCSGIGAVRPAGPAQRA